MGSLKLGSQQRNNRAILKLSFQTQPQTQTEGENTRWDQKHQRLWQKIILKKRRKEVFTMGILPTAWIWPIALMWIVWTAFSSVSLYHSKSVLVFVWDKRRKSSENQHLRLIICIFRIYLFYLKNIYKIYFMNAKK